MGYRSQVAIAFEKKAFFKHIKDSKDSFKDADGIQITSDSVLFKWDYTKWYDDYPDIIAIERVISDIEDDENLHDGDYFGFLRVGEENGDIETRGEPSMFEIYPVTTVDVESFKGDKIDPEELFKPNSIDFIKEE